MTAELAGPGATTAPPWLTSLFERDEPTDRSVAAAPSAECVLPSTTTSPAVARDFTARILRDWGLSRLVPDAQVVVSELVTNALRHAPTSTSVTSAIRLRLVRHRFHIGCGVSDGSARPPAPSTPGDRSETGRGLQLINALSLGWGWLRTRGGGKVVWALLDAGGR